MIIDARNELLEHMDLALKTISAEGGRITYWVELMRKKRLILRGLGRECDAKELLREVSKRAPEHLSLFNK